MTESEGRETDTDQTRQNQGCWDHVVNVTTTDRNIVTLMVIL